MILMAHMAHALIPLLLAAPSAQTPPDPNDEAVRSPREEVIQVLEEPWKVGDLKTYSLIFDHAPFGRQTIRLDRIHDASGERVLEFSQTLHLDLRALGQEGALNTFGNVRYARGKIFRRYRLDEVLQSWSGYSTYEPATGMRERSVELAQASSGATLAIGMDGKPAESVPLRDALAPDGPHAGVLVDLEVIGHWERIFLYDTWVPGEEKRIQVLVPSEPVVYDYHLPVKEFRPIAPQVREVALRVGPLEPVSVFSVEIQAFRCTLPELGYTLWVTPRGGVIRFENGRGLTGILER